MNVLLRIIHVEEAISKVTAFDNATRGVLSSNATSAHNHGSICFDIGCNCAAIRARRVKGAITNDSALSIVCGGCRKITLQRKSLSVQNAHAKAFELTILDQVIRPDQAHATDRQISRIAWAIVIVVVSVKRDSCDHTIASIIRLIIADVRVCVDEKDVKAIRNNKPSARIIRELNDRLAFAFSNHLHSAHILCGKAPEDHGFDWRGHARAADNVRAFVELYNPSLMET